MCFSISKDRNVKISSKERSPRNKDRIIERSTGREKNVGITGKLGILELFFGHKSIHGTEFTSDKWKLTDSFSHETGCCWLYKYNFGNFDDNPSFGPKKHSGEWYIKGGCGFRVTITQVLRFKIKSVFNI